MGADLVRRDGREPMKRSHVLDGERISIKHTYRNVIVNSCLTRSAWTFAIYLRQLVDIFAAPPKPWETQQCEVMSLQRLIATSCRPYGLPQIYLQLVPPQHTCTLMCSCFCCSAPTIKQDRGHVSSLKKNFIFFRDGSNLKIRKRHSRCICCCSQSLKEKRSFFQKQICIRGTWCFYS